MTYPQTIQYLETFINYEKIPAYPYKESLKLEQIKNFLDVIGNPQDSLKCIHIAGTKGKGSTCAFIAYILRRAGYKVGLYTSPHLSDFRERIRILSHQVPGASGTRCPIEFAPGARLSSHQVPEDFEGMISQNDVADLAERLKPQIQIYNKNSEYGPLSLFEIYTSLAFVYFKEKKVDFAVLETGLGGRLDATNVVDPLVAAITPISYEHTQKLGNTLKEIAAEKAGIIKIPNPKSQIPNLIVISAPQGEEAGEVIRKKCGETGAKLYEVGRDISYQKTNDGFAVKGIAGEYADLRIRLLGMHQLINAAVALGVIEALGFHHVNPVRNTKAIISENKISNGVNVGIEAIKGGLYDTVWPGRCEVISQDPLIVLDGAQNIASILALKETVKENFPYKRLILVLGISNDKDIKGICSELYELADEIILTKAESPRATEPDILAQYFHGRKTHITNSVKEARDFAERIMQKKDLILVCGSLFVVGDFRDGRIRYQ